MAELVYAPVLGTGSRKGLEVRVLSWAQKIQVIYERERGRENGSFPVVEILKPQGFKESAAADDVRVLSWAQKK